MALLYYKEEWTDGEKDWNLAASRYLFQLRNDLGMSYREFAAKTGISHPTVQMAEHGRNRTTITLLSRIAEALEIDLTRMIREIVRRMDDPETPVYNVEIEDAYDIR